MSEGWFLTVMAIVAASLAAGTIRLCLRDVWDGLAAATLFIALYAALGGAIGHWAENMAARELWPGLSRGTLVLVGAFAGIWVPLVAVCAVVAAARRRRPERLDRERA